MDTRMPHRGRFCSRASTAPCVRICKAFCSIASKRDYTQSTERRTSRLYLPLRPAALTSSGFPLSTMSNWALAPSLSPERASRRPYSKSTHALSPSCDADAEAKKVTYGHSKRYNGLVLSWVRSQIPPQTQTWPCVELPRQK